MGGKPCIRGLRVTVGTVVGLLAAGESRERILAAYPYLESADLEEALAYAAWQCTDNKVINRYWGGLLVLEMSMTSATEIQYVSDERGNKIGVIVPIDLWREIEAERETAYLLKSETMKRRLLEAKSRQSGMAFEEVLEKLGI